MASTETKRCLDCQTPLPCERSFVRCQACVERNMAAYHASAMTDTVVPLSPERDMTTDEFNVWARRLGLSEKELARRLETTQPTINRWTTGQRKPPPYLWRALEHLERELEEERRPNPQPPRTGGFE